MDEWCRKWRLKLNTSKMNVVRFRNTRTKKSTFEFEYNGSKIDTISEYKYLGVIMDEHLNFKSCSKKLADSGSRALSAIISHLKTFKNIGFKTYTKSVNLVLCQCLTMQAEYGENVMVRILN